MKLNVFACRGGFLLSPDCMFTPRDATEAYRPVAAILGLVECEDLPKKLCDRITADIDRQQFSFVTSRDAVRVRLSELASKHPFDKASQLHPEHG